MLFFNAPRSQPLLIWCLTWDTAKGNHENCATETQIQCPQLKPQRNIKQEVKATETRRNKLIAGGGWENIGMEFCKEKSQAKGGGKNNPSWAAAAHLLDVSLREVEELVPDLRYHTLTVMTWLRAEHIEKWCFNVNLYTHYIGKYLLNGTWKKRSSKQMSQIAQHV